jgi:hypothetical protein
MLHSKRRSGARRFRIAILAGVTAVVPIAVATPAAAEDGGVSDAPILGSWEPQSLSGVNNNPYVPNAGAVGTRYLRIGPARYADGRSQMVAGPDPRAVSNRIFNDVNANVFSERGVTQWGNAWGQFVDHNVGHRDEAGTTANLPFNSADPMESFTNTLGMIPFTRSAAAPGTGVSNARQHVNTENSFLDAEAVYGPSDTRLDWLRDGSLDGNPDNNAATMMLPGNYLPRADARGNPSAAPFMQVDGRLLANPARATVSGDVRTNEQAALTATQTLFAREHNRVVAALPANLSAQDKFQLARAVVIAEIQYITYNEFLPAIGVSLPAYQGYNPNLNPATSHEFATVGYRAHSFIHGEIETDTEASRYSQATLDALEAQGVEVTVAGDEVTLAVPDNVLFFNPGLVEQMQLGPIMTGLAGESDYRNDEMIDNQLRSILFRIPVSGNPDCLDGPELPQCFDGVMDLGAIDLQRGRDHGMPTYNQMRNSYGLASKTSFTAITGESTDAFPADPLLTPGNEINDPNCLDILAAFDIHGNPTDVANENATRVVRRCTVAAKLKAIYGSVSNVDAFTGMMAEKHLAGSELGELQLAIWRDQFRAARDGDRFFYRNDPLQSYIRTNFGIDSRRTLAQVIADNTDIPLSELPANVFRLPGSPDVGAGKAVAAQPIHERAGLGTVGTPAASDLTRHTGKQPRTATKQAFPDAVAAGYPASRALGRRRRARTAQRSR